MNRCAIAMMFVCLSGTLGVFCDHTVLFNVDLSLWLDSPVSWALWHQSMSIYCQPSFSSSTWKKGGVWMCKQGVTSQEWLKIEVKLLLSANRKWYMPCLLAQQQMTLSDLEWRFHTLHAMSAVAELVVLLLLTCCATTRRNKARHCYMYTNLSLSTPCILTAYYSQLHE